MGQKRYPDGLKGKIVRAILEGRMTYQQGAEESGAPIRQVRVWVNNYRQVAVMHSLGSSPGTPPASTATPTPTGTPAPAPKPTPAPAKPVEKPAAKEPEPTKPTPTTKPATPPPPARKRDL